MSIEAQRLNQSRLKKEKWRKWGPYLSERQWGTVREDYSAEGHAWGYFPHDHARSRTYRWGEDGIAGICDDEQRLCFSIALWNGEDAILKERLFGLSNQQGNHGEDVKEYYFPIDNVPSHAYMKYLYKYPQQAFPYEELLSVNQSRDRSQPEYELVDTGIFDENRYFDVFVEYAKDDPEDLCIKITIANRGTAAARLHVLPTLWFRNTWSWMEGVEKPELKKMSQESLRAHHPEMGSYCLEAYGLNEWLFTDNETNNERLYKSENASPYVKDAFHRYLIDGESEAVNPYHSGTKAAAHYLLHVPAEDSVSIYLRLHRHASEGTKSVEAIEPILQKRLEEADAFYHEVTPSNIPSEMRSVQRQAYAGLLWNKQFYHYNVEKWLKGDPTQPPPPEQRVTGRNSEWPNFNASDIFSMPDKWEYPWFAAWDLAFHCVVLATIDPEFAKKQVQLLLHEWYMHPNGQIPAYEWSFGDLNPPVQAWAALRVFQIERTMHQREDRLFLKEVFQKLALNFTWWVNREDKDSRNVFEGGFLGLDNISAFDRDKQVPPGARLDQVDGTGWMGMYCLNLLQMALVLAEKEPAYEDMATKFFEHFVYIADAMNSIGGHSDGLWNDTLGFYYSQLTMADGEVVPLNMDTFVGLIPIFAAASNKEGIRSLFPKFRQRCHWFIKHHPELLQEVLELDDIRNDDSFLFSLTSPRKLRGILGKVFDEEQFLSPHGIRSVSKRLGENPFVVRLDGTEFRLDYEPAESSTPLFGGNSNWRGPIWFPLNFLFIEALQRYHYYLGNEFTVEYPTGSGQEKNLWDISMDLSRRLIGIFLPDEEGRRPVFGGTELFQSDPHWKGYLRFHEYFHGDSGAGIGASCQTGWTGLVAKMIHQYGEYVVERRAPSTIEEEERVAPI